WRPRKPPPRSRRPDAPEEGGGRRRSGNVLPPGLGEAGRFSFRRKRAGRRRIEQLDQPRGRQVDGRSAPSDDPTAHAHTPPFERLGIGAAPERGELAGAQRSREGPRPSPGEVEV